MSQVALLPPVAAALQNRHAIDADIRESILHVIQLEGLDDRFNLLHVLSPASMLARGTVYPKDMWRT